MIINTFSNTYFYLENGRARYLCSIHLYSTWQTWLLGKGSKHSRIHRLGWHRLNTVPCSHFGAKKGTKTAAMEQGFLARGEKLLGCFGFFIIEWKILSDYLKKKKFKLQEIRTLYLTAQTLTWLGSCFGLVLTAGLPWHTPTSSHLRGCSMGKTSDKNIRALTVNEQRCKHQPNLYHGFFLLVPRGNFKSMPKITEGEFPWSSYWFLSTGQGQGNASQPHMNPHSQVSCKLLADGLSMGWGLEPPDTSSAFSLYPV